MQKTLTETIVYRSLSDLRVSSNNYRHGDVGAIVTSILTFGFNATLRVWRDGVVKAGNHSLLALQSIKASGLPLPRGIREENGAWLVPCFDISHLSQIQADAFMIADNRLTAIGSDDDQRLAELLTEIASEDAKLLAATGYDGDDLDAILSELANDALGGMEAPDAQVDKADELREKWQTERGQLWVIGKHRLLCGDSTNADDVARVMGGEKAALVVTDPPYGVDYGDKNAFLNSTDGGNRIETAIAGDYGTKADIQATWKSAFKNMSDVMGAGAAVYCFMPQGGDQMMMMMMMMTGAGIEPRHEIIWLKNNHVLGRSDYQYKHEPILYAWKEGGHKFYGGFQTSIIECDRPQKSGLHPTTKPTELICKLINNSSLRSEVVYEPFNGSGTTLVACEQTGRMGRGIEIDPRYVAVTLQRLADMGLTPKLI